MNDSIIQSITIAKPGDIVIVRVRDFSTQTVDTIQSLIATLDDAGLKGLIVPDDVEISTTTPPTAAPTPAARFVPARLTVDGSPSILDRSTGMVAPFISDDVRDRVMRSLNDSSSSTYPFSWTSAPHEAEQ